MSDLRHLALFLVGFVLLAAAFGLGIGAFEYEVVSEGEVDGPPEGKRFVANESPEGFEDTTIVVVQYENLSTRDQAVVDRVLAGERLVYRESGQLPGKYEKKGRFAVRHDGTTYLVNRHLFFNPRSPFGVASILLGAVGLVAVSEAVRRRHFPHRPMYWIRA